MSEECKHMNPTISLIITYILMLSLLSSFFKGMNFSFFYLNTYEIVNKKIPLSIIKVSSLLFITLEFFIPLYALLNFQLSYLYTLIMIVLYIIPTIILIYAIMTGNRNKECGCFGINISVKISWKKILTNITYILFLCLGLYLKNIDIKVWYIVIIICLLLLYFIITKVNTKG